jgi:two-component system chemotaxis response regulator CheY
VTIPRQTQDGSIRVDVDVLVIDDSDLARGAVVRVLTQAGLVAEELSTPIGVTQALLRRRVRLVLIDYDMPSLRGDRLIELVRKNPRLRHTKLVLISGTDLADLRAIAMSAGADAVIAKSDGPAEVLRIVRGLLAQVAAETG